VDDVLIASILLAALVVAGLLGRSVRRHFPENHLSAESKEAAKLAMGLAATMTAFIRRL
jgi:hypothetical protein